MSMDSFPKGSFEKKHELTESDKEHLIRSTHSFSQLYDALDRIVSVEGSQETYTAEQLKNKIERVRSGELTLDYVTRTYGIRETVERLLKTKRSPEPPPPLEAAVALEIPRDEEREIQAEAQPPSPEEPPELEASVKLDIPTEDDIEKDSVKETSPKDPITPLTDQEDLFLKNAFYYPGYYADMGEPEREARHVALREKKDRYDAIAVPNSFDALESSLKASGGVEVKGEILTGAQLWEQIVKVRSGQAELSILPEVIRYGVRKLVAESVRNKFFANHAIQVPPHEWDIFMQHFPPHTDYLGTRGYLNGITYPEIGATNVQLRDAVIEGELVWANDRERMVIFKTPIGMRMISSDEIVMSNGKTRRENEEDARRRRSIQSRNRGMERPLP